MRNVHFIDRTQRTAHRGNSASVRGMFAMGMPMRGPSFEVFPTRGEPLFIFLNLAYPAWFLQGKTPKAAEDFAKV